jgi:hypothetical protein
LILIVEIGRAQRRLLKKLFWFWAPWSFVSRVQTAQTAIELVLFPGSMSTAEERKRKRLEAWRNRQQQQEAPAPAPKVSISLGGLAGRKKKKGSSTTTVTTNVMAPKKINPFFADDEHSGVSDHDDEAGSVTSLSAPSGRKKTTLPKLTLDALAQPSPEKTSGGGGGGDEPPPRKRAKGSRRWDKAPESEKTTTTSSSSALLLSTTAHDDALDSFMKKLEAGAMGNVTTQRDGGEDELKINVSGSMMPCKQQTRNKNPNPVSGGVITPEELERLTGGKTRSSSEDIHKDAMDVDDSPRYTHSDWESEGSKSEVRFW